MAAVLRRLGLKRSSSTAGTAGADHEDFGDADILDTLDFSTYFMSYRLHQRSPLSVPATLFFPEATSAARLAQAGAASLLDPCRIEIIPGNHTTCVTKHTAELAEKIRRIVDDLP
jgi:hypothetical protein